MKTIIWNNLEKKGELFMLQFLQTGKMLYALAGICAVGIVSKLITSSIYKRLIKETGNMALTKNKNLRALKQKTENLFLINHGVRNAAAYIERQLYGFRFMKISLDGWDNFCMQTMILSFLAGGAAAFGAYWYRCDPYYIVLYGTAGVLMGLALVLVDNSANIGLKRQQLIDSLLDYVENSPHFYKAIDRAAEAADQDKKSKVVAVNPTRLRVRDLGSDAKGGNRDLDEAAAGWAGRKPVAMQEDDAQADRGAKLSVLSKKKDKHGAGRAAAQEAQGINRPAGKSGQEMRETERSRDVSFGADRPGDGRPLTSGDEDLGSDIEYLCQSLEQIAAGRESAGQGSVGREIRKSQERPKRELKPEELKLLGDILQDYLS